MILVLSDQISVLGVNKVKCDRLESNRADEGHTNTYAQEDEHLLQVSTAYTGYMYSVVKKKKKKIIPDQVVQIRLCTPQKTEKSGYHTNSGKYQVMSDIHGS